MSGYFELATSAAGRFSFNLKAGNHQVILTSQSYTSKQDALNGIESVRTNASIDSRFERKIAKNDAPYFLLLAANGQTIGKSEMYSTNAAMENGVKSVMRNGTTTLVKGVD